jgi:hypothetical protein
MTNMILLADFLGNSTLSIYGVRELFDHRGMTLFLSNFLSPFGTELFSKKDMLWPELILK